jgi:hypothetical protein
MPRSLTELRYGTRGAAVGRGHRLGIGRGAHGPDQGDMCCLGTHLAELTSGHVRQSRYRYGNESGSAPARSRMPGGRPTCGAGKRTGGAHYAVPYLPGMRVTGVHFGAPQETRYTARKG